MKAAISQDNYEHMKILPSDTDALPPYESVTFLVSFHPKTALFS